MRTFLLAFIFLINTPVLSSNTCNSEKSVLKNKLITLINKTLIAQNYWRTLKHDSFKRLRSRTPVDWLFYSWKNEIPVRLNAIQEVQTDLAEILACCNQHTYEETLEHLKKAEDTLEQHGIPHHLSRHWLTYTAAGIAACGGVYGVRTYLHNKQLVTIADSAGFLQIREKLVQENIAAEAYRYNDTNYLLFNTNQVFQALPILNGRGINTNEIRNPTIKELSILFHDTKGTDLFTKFYTAHIANPLKQIWFNLKKPSIEPIAPTENNHDLEKTLIKSAQKGLEEGRYNELYTAQEILTKQLNNLRSREEMYVLIQKIIDKTVASGEIWMSELGKIVSVVTPSFLGGERPRETSAWIQGLWANVKTTKAKIDGLAVKVEKGTETNIEIAMMAPAGLAVYALYTAYKTAVQSISSTKVTNPLKEDLVACERLLNQHRCQQELSLFHQGMLLYWVEKLTRYQLSIPKTYRVRFEQDLQDLGSESMNLEQKYQTVHAMMRDYAFLL